MTDVHEFVIFSDHHAHNHKYGAVRRELVRGNQSTVHNSRLLDSVAVINEIAEYVKNNNIRTTIFAGDLFHTRGTVPTDVYNLTYEAVRGIPGEVIMIPGNHDFADRDGKVHSLEPFKDMMAVYDVPWSCSGYGDLSICFHFVPYSDIKGKIVKDIAELPIVPGIPNVLIGHAGIQGAKVGSDYVLVNDSDMEITDIDLTRFTACFFGHFHKHQMLARNAWYVGATHQHNWGDAGCRRGFLHVTIRDGKTLIKQIESSAPKFVNISSLEEFDINSNNFVRLHMDVPTDAKLEQYTKKLGYPQKIEVISPAEEGVADEDNVFDLDINTLIPSHLVSYWNTLHGRDDSLAKLGLEILAEAEVKS